MSFTVKNRPLLVSAFAVLAAALMAACGTVGAATAPIADTGPTYSDDVSAANSQPAAQAATDGNTITVTGTGQAFGEADFATVELGVEVLNEQVGVAIDESSAIIEDMTTALTELGVSEEDIQTVRFSVWQEGQGRPMAETPEEERIFRVTNTVLVRIRDVENVSPVIDAALNAGATQVYGLNYSIQDTGPLQDEARTEAVADARERAEALAEALGVTLGEPVSISEGQGAGRPIYPAAEGAGGGGPAINQGQLSVNLSVTISYAIGE